MDGDKNCEREQQDSTPQAESCTSETTSEDVAQKRKRTEEEDSEDNQNTKKVKVDDKGEKAASNVEELSKKKDMAAEGEEDKSITSEEKQAMVEEKEMSSEAKQITSEEKLEMTVAKEEKEQEAMSEEKEVKSEEKQAKSEEKISVGEEKKGLDDRKEDKTACEAAHQSKEEAMEVEESKTEKTEGLTSDTETLLPDIKSENKAQEELHTEKIKEEKSDPKLEPGSEKKEEKLEVVQRRYPTRSRRTEEKGAFHQPPLKASSAVSEEKKGGNPGREDVDGEVARASSVKSDNGSDKENMNGEMGVRGAETPDVILLSEDEETEQGKEKRAKRRKLVRRLQAHLRNEEAKLVLLKKLRQSQLTPQVQDHTSTPTSTTAGHLAKQTLPRQQGGPPPLVRGGQQVRGTNLHMQQQQQQNRNPSQGQMRNMQGPPPLVVTPRMGSGAANGPSGQLRNNAASHVNQHGSSTLRPTQQQQQQNQQQHQQSGQQQASTPPQPPVDTQTPAQRQAAAKLALRKQLEKTLLQIPPPKPPAPEMNFIPSLACPDFVLLLGLEEVVNHIIDLQLIARGQKSPDEKFICNPFTCVQCGTDYTPVWKREKPGSKNVICEHCVTWNQKRALKQEHTNRLKSAFVKALQQEQEIERMQAQTPSNPSTPTPSGTPPTSSSSAPPQALAAAAAASNVAAAAAMTMSPASFRPSAEQVRQHHSFLQAQAQLRAGQPLAGLQGFGGRPPFYNLPYVKQSDLQRQYLLDIIPRATGMPWKQ